MASDAPISAKFPPNNHKTGAAVVPRVSIGMPVYNGESFIREALDSLVTQTFTDFELIISDNASTDGTETICHEYAARDARIRYVRQAENRGATANFHFVMTEAVGEYFMWAAADDLQSPNFIELLVAVLDENPSIVCVMTDVLNIVDSKNDDSFVTMIDDIRVDDVINNWTKCRRRFYRNPTSNIFFCIYGLYRTNVIHAIDLNYNKLNKYAFSSEVPLLAQVANRGKIATIPGPAKIYRRHDQSVYNQEQKVLKKKDRLLGFGLVSLSLLLIAIRSSLSIYEKFFLIGTTTVTSFRWVLSLPIIKISHIIKNFSIIK